MTCWPLSTSSPVSRSMNAVARPPSSPRASSTRTRCPASASAVAADRPATPAPTTAISNLALLTVARSDPRKDAAIDTPHDARRHQPARIAPWQHGVGTAVIVARALRLVGQQLLHCGRVHAVPGMHRLCANISLVTPEPRDVVL